MTINDTDRENWIANDEGLYRWHLRSKLSLRTFIRLNREGIDAHIRMVNNREPAK